MRRIDGLIGVYLAYLIEFIDLEEFDGFGWLPFTRVTVHYGIETKCIAWSLYPR